MAKRTTKKLDEFHWHEALDRSFLAFEFFSENVAEHVAICSSKQLKRDAAEISDRMFRLYQELGRKTMDDSNGKR